MKKIFITLLLCTIIIFWIDEKRSHQAGKRFAPEKVFSWMPPHTEWQLPPLDNQEEIRKILSQDFIAISKGNQAYVFESLDRNYVLKIFKQHKLRPTTFFSRLNFKKYDKKKKIFIDALNSCKTAFLNFKEETGLLYLHLNKEPDLCCQVTCINEKQRKYTFSIDDTVFMLQKKATLIYPTIQHYMTSGQEDKAKELLTSLISLLSTFSEQGVYDNDADLKKNFGVINETQVIQIDVGTFHIDPQKHEDITIPLQPLYSWLTTYYPSLLSHLQSTLPTT